LQGITRQATIESERFPTQISFEGVFVKVWTIAGLKLLWGAYFLLTSVYCLLAFLPYTYYALIKAPPYAWMPWFAHHQPALFWMTLLAAAFAYWFAVKSGTYFALFGMQILLGIYITVKPFLPTLQSNASALMWSLVALSPVILIGAADLVCQKSRMTNNPDLGCLLTYSAIVCIAFMVALLSAAGTHVRSYAETHSWNLHAGDLELAGWSVISHVFVAILILTILNLIFVVSRKTVRPQLSRVAMLGVLIWLALWTALLRFLENALSVQGWPAYAYAGTLAAALALLGFSIVLPFRFRAGADKALSPGGKAGFIVIAAALSLATLVLPSLIAGGDWNGVLQSTFTLLFWLGFSVCFFRLRPRSGSYSLSTILGIVVLTAFTYKGLQASAIFWGKPLGATDDDIARTMESYASQDASFQLAHHLLGNARVEPCGDLCRIMREHTNIRDAHTKTEVNLVEPLLPAAADRPNIFIFVIDSLRPDYLGAYNPKVDFTPNLDSFAHESIALRNVYTQYAGTTLSEPAIWSGAMLLHTHYLQPFSKVNSLEKMAHADNYQTVVSFDTVLSQILTPADDLIKLDTDKSLWNHFEVCSTVQQLEGTLDRRPDKLRPVLFYTQPMNVHQFANNDLPGMTSENWKIRPGFQNRIAYEVHTVDECMGQFISYLKARGIYDNSIVVLTSDHGDATGQFGRTSHSISIYPEIMRVPLIVHLPSAMRNRFVYDDSQLSTLTDITPSLYYLLGHKAIETNPLYGRPIFVETTAELDRRQPRELFLASDVRAVYGILADNGRYLYVTYDSPADSFLFDLASDPNAEHNILNPTLKKQYDERIIQHLQGIADFYGYKPGVGSLLASAH
jgi:hypothetical protein